MPDQDLSRTTAANFTEVGISGLERYGADVYEEFLPALRGHRGMKVFKEMSMNDPTIGAILFVAEQLIRRVTWGIEAGGSSRVDKEAKEFLASCMEDMSATWADTIAEILSYFVYGWSWHEIVYKRRLGESRNPTTNSQYNDGRIGWRKLAGRSQMTLYGWKFQKDGGIIAMEQKAPPDFTIRTIPLEKSLLFRSRADKNNPEGRSLLRNAYRPWYFKKHIEEIEGIGIERDLAGLPVLIPPDGLDIWEELNPDMVRMKTKAEKLIRNIRRDQSEGVVLPFGWELKLLSTGSRRQFDTNAILNRYDQRIAITMLADIVLLGADKVGSFALADAKKGLMAAAIDAQLHGIAEVFNRYAIPRLFAVNSFPGLKQLPKLLPDTVVAPDLVQLAAFISDLAGHDVFAGKEADLENHLRRLAGLPKRAEDSKLGVQRKPEPKPPVPSVPPVPGEGKEEVIDDPGQSSKD